MVLLIPYRLMSLRLEQLLVLVLCLPRIYIDLTEIILAQWRLLGLVMLVLDHLMWSLQLIWRVDGRWGSFCLFVLEYLELQITFFSVDGLVVRLRCLSGKIVVHIISMQDIYHNFLCSRWFSRLAKFLDCKDCYFPYYLSFLTLG